MQKQEQAKTGFFCVFLVILFYSNSTSTIEQAWVDSLSLPMSERNLEKPPVGVESLKRAGRAWHRVIGSARQNLKKGLRSKRSNGCRQQLSSVVLVNADTVVQASNWQISIAEGASMSSPSRRLKRNRQKKTNSSPQP
ncbi:hypothetical protein J3E68DRAFT_419201 [Trichoderma sp. SZMC 28012]